MSLCGDIGGTRTYLDDVSNQVWQNFVLLDLLAVLPNLLLHDILFVLQAESLGAHNLQHTMQWFIPAHSPGIQVLVPSGRCQ